MNLIKRILKTYSEQSDMYFKNCNIILTKIVCVLFVFSIYSSVSNGQECSDYYNYSKFVNCKKCINRNYKLYMPPKNTTIGVDDTLTFTIMFYDNRDYLISFCTDQKYYPINIKLIESATGKELYDNAKDNYCESFGVGFYNTCNLTIKVSLLANKTDNDKLKKNEKACVGMILQWKKVLYSKNKLYVEEKQLDKFIMAYK